MPAFRFIPVSLPGFPASNLEVRQRRWGRSSCFLRLSIAANSPRTPWCPCYHVQVSSSAPASPADSGAIPRSLRENLYLQSVHQYRRRLDPRQEVHRHQDIQEVGDEEAVSGAYNLRRLRGQPCASVRALGQQRPVQRAQRGVNPVEVAAPVRGQETVGQADLVDGEPGVALQVQRLSLKVAVRAGLSCGCPRRSSSSFSIGGHQFDG